MPRYMNFIANHRQLKKFDSTTKWRLRQLKLVYIEKYRVFDKFDRQGAAYDDVVWILNRF